ncbi:YebC/PmpR family DNA-binding transcriptional regulator [Candidatus Saccharibacteria bacterium]|nr:YebC/PmpR family DNA-binding transcriptional regulator [Candidatus Saccharibacteria bacterium]
MSGHSKWETTKRQKAVVDAKRGAVFTKLGNMIAIAARKGTNPDMNPALALAIDKAKHANMPASNIQRAIDRVSDKNASALEEIVYEAYGPGGIGIIIETATDNRNRTLPEVRTTLTKNGGTIADPGSVAFQFDHKGVIRVEATGDEALMTILDAGAEDATDDGKEITAITDMRDLHQVRQAIVDAGLTVADAGLEYVGKTQVEVNDPDKAARAMRLLNALDDLDDVTGVHTNADITAEV